MNSRGHHRAMQLDGIKELLSLNQDPIATAPNIH